MLNLKQFINSFVAEILQLPVIYFRTHVYVLARGVRGAYAVERHARRDDRRFLSLRAIAVINIVLIFAGITAINDQTNPFDTFFRTLLKPEGILDPQFSRTLGAVIAMYTLFYALSRLVAKPFANADLMAAAAIYFATLTLLAYVLLYLFGLSSGGLLVPNLLAKYIARICILATYAYAFHQIGAGLTSRVRLRISRPARRIIAVTFGALSLGVYLLGARLCLTDITMHELVWPSFPI
jgi:hypothetical protein